MGEMNDEFFVAYKLILNKKLSASFQTLLRIWSHVHRDASA